jgi:hypothetical protein
MHPATSMDENVSKDPCLLPGYLNAGYAESLSAFGVPRFFPSSVGWVLERQTPCLPLRDAMGLYPLFCCSDWTKVQDDLAALNGNLVCLSLVADPFGNHTPELLRATFDRVIPLKEHFVADLSRPVDEFTSPRHRKHARRAMREVTVSICERPENHLDEWTRLYDCLIERHGITGIRCFSRDAFARQLVTPGLVMFRASVGSETVGMDLWYQNHDVAYAHLFGMSPLGYELQASYALKYYILEYFTGRVRWLDLGGGSGNTRAAASGLAAFKQGWASGTRTAWFCTKVFNSADYARLVNATDTDAASFFPAYRANETF